MELFNWAKSESHSAESDEFLIKHWILNITQSSENYFHILEIVLCNKGYAHLTLRVMFSMLLERLFVNRKQLFKNCQGRPMTGTTRLMRTEANYDLCSHVNLTLAIERKVIWLKWYKFKQGGILADGHLMIKAPEKLNVIAELSNSKAMLIFSTRSHLLFVNNFWFYFI